MSLYADEMLALLKKVAPEQIMEMARRVQVMKGIENMQPVGRRSLSNYLHLSEREVRAAAASLKDEGLVQMDAAGMQLTGKAIELMPKMHELSRVMSGLSELERKIAEKLNVQHVVIVPGDSDQDAQVLRDVGRAAGHRIRYLLKDGMTVAVGGGQTMLDTARGITLGTPVDAVVVPARGGMGSSVETQASAVAAEFARRLGGHFRIMHLPDNVDEKMLIDLCRQKDVRETIELLRHADIVVHGIGRADRMAEARGFQKAECTAILEKGAVGEAFGDFFDREGHTVFQLSTVSAELTRHQSNPMVIAAAAGKDKAEAISACMIHEVHDTLITDEATANVILTLQHRLNQPQGCEHRTTS